MKKITLTIPDNCTFVLAEDFFSCFKDLCKTAKTLF